MQSRAPLAGGKVVKRQHDSIVAKSMQRPLSPNFSLSPFQTARVWQLGLLNILTSEKNWDIASASYKHGAHPGLMGGRASYIRSGVLWTRVLIVVNYRMIQGPGFLSKWSGTTCPFFLRYVARHVLQ